MQDQRSSEKARHDLSRRSSRMNSSDLLGLRKTAKSMIDRYAHPDKTGTFDCSVDDNPGVTMYQEKSSQPLSYCGYMAVLTICIAISSTAAVMLWSDMGCGMKCQKELEKRSEYSLACAGCVAVIMIFLYIFDFFTPPHLPGRYLMFCETDCKVGRLLLLLAVVLLAATGFLLAKTIPAMPLCLTVFSCPIGILFARHWTLPSEKWAVQANDKDLLAAPLERKLVKLRELAAEAANQADFYRAFMHSFVLVGLVLIAVWIPWGLETLDDFEDRAAAASNSIETERLWLFWCAPLLVAACNFVFAGLSAYRLMVNRSYQATDSLRNTLIVGTVGSENTDFVNYRLSLLNRKIDETTAGTAVGQAREQLLRQTQDKVQRYLVQHIKHVKELVSTLKVILTIFILFAGALYCTLQLAVADSHLAEFTQGLLAFFFVSFLVFVYVSLHRVFAHTDIWLNQLPILRSIKAILGYNFFRATLVVVALPVFAVLFLLSALNQRIRILRGIEQVVVTEPPDEHSSSQADAGNEVASSPTPPAIPSDEDPTMEQARKRKGWKNIINDALRRNRVFTVKVQAMLDAAARWQWMNVMWWIYIVAWVIIIWKTVTPLLNVALAWLSATVGHFDFIWILILTYSFGMFLFLLPPVPGPPIYLFGGFIIADKCPWGFWWGCVICVGLCFFLKLSACTVQQKIFGEILGWSEWVRKTVRVHSPFIRAIENILRTRGLSVGKCAILCGGPDWPTSVLAGILRLSLVRCLVGTIPIIINVIPLVLTGAFYLRRDESKLWKRAGNLMLALTIMTTAAFWAGMAWAVQNQFDTHHENLHKPQKQYLQLDWLDYRQEYIQKRGGYRWQDLPKPVKVVFFSGAFIHALASQVFLWRFEVLVGSFQINDDVKTLRWFGAEGLVKIAGVALFTLIAIGCIGMISFYMWTKRRWQRASKAAQPILDGMEEAWKESRFPRDS